MSGETEKDISGWTVDTLHSHFDHQIDSLRAMLEERFTAQQTAMQAAFAAAEKAVDRQTATLDKEFHEHLVQYRHEVSLAFEASDKAISKAEVATEKRLENMNEFRAQLSSQAATLMARGEADIQFTAIETKMADESKRNTERFAEINKRLDLYSGGLAATSRLIGVGLTVLGLILTAVVFLANYFTRQ